MVGEVRVAGSPKALDARLEDGFAAAFVFVVRAGIADARGGAARRCSVPHAVQLGAEHDAVMWPAASPAAPRRSTGA
jgi:hypothetical protein